jgi:hypothetical protein
LRIPQLRDEVLIEAIYHATDAKGGKMKKYVATLAAFA